ncbi:hypothetical protein RBH94_15850 [Aestuariibaculum sp. YM273]|uniref:hypothetical protein n=1 Tax=Aestuariibaculum sp. YM273 TaxID=3070659 RepID=UPI0027DD5156|nr:hypothetical protein [Aestuariibaculum sp. YM273]WMI65525.1 hypothetical protein RBH94_15850 [Aestuariibaculum sp. YM273]
MEELTERIKDLINTCWNSYSAKVGGELLTVNKEASMQLQFAYLLKNSIDLAIYHKDESVTIELETGILVGDRMRECDIVIQIVKGNECVYLPLELKCYKYLAASGGKRGAVDIFFKDVYADLELLEAYAENENYIDGIQLTMTDFKNLPFPSKKTSKYFAYDISEGTEITNGIHLNTPIGGKDIDITLRGNYKFHWVNAGEFYFLKLENIR